MATSRPSPAALGLAPLVLRLAIGLLFTWTGLVKWFGTVPVQGEDAALLGNMDAINRPAAPAPAVTPASPTTPPAAPLPPSTPATPSKPHASAGGSIVLLAQTPPPIPGTAAPKTPPPVTTGPAILTAADYPDPVPCRAVWKLALTIHHAAHPESGKMHLWPQSLGEGLWPKVFALTVLIFELGGGICLLIGLFTRLAAFGEVCVMLGAMWLTQFGPAIQSGSAKLGFLPAHEWTDIGAWQTLVVQGLALAAAFALMCLGSGAAAFDRALAGYRSAAPSKPASSSPVQSGGAGAR